ncbi:MAG: GNAT family N-acetyltransferase [Pseudomonadota bacterium]
MSLTIRRAESRFDFAACVYLRTIVFFVEQDCPFHEEINAEEDEATYYIAWKDDLPAATARTRIKEDGTYKIERVCTAKEYRGQGYGKDIMQFIIDDIESQNPKAPIKLSSQDHAMPFYEKLGFQAIGNGYMEANIPHHMMEKQR